MDSWMCGLGDDVEFGRGLEDVDLRTMWTFGSVGSETCEIGEL